MLAVAGTTLLLGVEPAIPRCLGTCAYGRRTVQVLFACCCWLYLHMGYLFIRNFIYPAMHAILCVCPSIHRDTKAHYPNKNITVVAEESNNLHINVFARMAIIGAAVVFAQTYKKSLVAQRLNA